MEAISISCLIFLIFCLDSCYGHTTTPYENTTLTLHTGLVTWPAASGVCEETGESFLNLIKNDANIRGQIKREVHFNVNNSAWIGIYETFDIELRHDRVINVTKSLCLTMRFTSERLRNDLSYDYTYDVLVVNCSEYYFSVCNDSTGRLHFSESITSRQHACSPPWMLWTPPITLYPIAHGMSTVGHGNFSVKQHNGDLVGNTYWVQGLVTTNVEHLPVKGNILRCGYITKNPNVEYDDCYQMKSYICESRNDTTTEEQTIEQAHETMTSSKVGIYVGAAVGSLTFIVLCVIVVILTIRKKNKRVQDSPANDILPKGGHSFTRPNDSVSTKGASVDHTTGPTAIDTRVSMYNKIDIDPSPEPKRGNGIKIDNQSQKSLSGPSVDSSAEFVYAMYDPAKKTANKGASSAHINVGYLTMDGKKRQDDSDYDVLKTTGSMKNGVPADTEENVYNVPLTEEQESFYDSTIITRNLSQKALINNDYDHVTLTRDPEMDRSVCNSIGITTSGSSKRPVPIPRASSRSNPGYEKSDKLIE